MLTKNNSTVLHAAATNGHYETACILLKVNNDLTVWGKYVESMNILCKFKLFRRFSDEYHKL